MVVLASVIAGTCGASPAAAHRYYPFGGLFPHTAGTYLYLPYYIATGGAPTGYYTAINGGMRAWYDSPTQVWPYPSNYQTSAVDFYITSTTDTWWGLTINHPCSGVGCSYRYADVYLNRRTMDPETIFQSQAIVAHEVGHAMGLSHVCGEAACPPGSATTLMQWGRLPYNVPQNHDINDINAMYP